MQLTDDIKPIYLGCCKSQKKYYFYFIKEGIPRFLSYVTYFYWDRGPQEALVLVPVPGEIEKELEDFLIGDLHYEFRKIRKNSRLETVVKMYRTPQQVRDEFSAAPLPRRISGDSGGTFRGDTRITGYTGGIVVTVHKVRKKRRTKREMEAARELLVIPGALIKEQRGSVC